MSDNGYITGATRISRANLHNRMKAFDGLPRSARAALRESNNDWAAYPILLDWNAGHYSDARDIVRSVKRWDKQETKAYEKRLAAGFRKLPAKKRKRRVRRLS